MWIETSFEMTQWKQALNHGEVSHKYGRTLCFIPGKYSMKSRGRADWGRSYVDCLSQNLLWLRGNDLCSQAYVRSVLGEALGLGSKLVHPDVF